MNNQLCVCDCLCPRQDARTSWICASPAGLQPMVTQWMQPGFCPSYCPEHLAMNGSKYNNCSRVCEVLLGISPSFNLGRGAEMDREEAE